MSSEGVRLMHEALLETLVKELNSRKDWEFNDAKVQEASLVDDGIYIQMDLGYWVCLDLGTSGFDT